MKKIILTTFILSAIIFCTKKQALESDTRPDGYTYATPKGGELLPAERGPVRDVFEIPLINLETFKLTVDGLVNSPYSLSRQQIVNRKAVQTDTMNMYCVEGWEVWGVWRGVSLADLLDTAVPKPQATHVMFHGIDGYSSAMPIAYLRKYDTLLAYEVNGQPLGTHDGYPLRLVAFGLFGYKWAKYVTRLELIDGPTLGFWETYGYDDKAIVPLERRKFYEGDGAQPIEY